MVRLAVTSAPASEPLTTAEAKTHLRVDTSDDDTYIDTLVASARQWVENYTDLALVTQTITEYFDAFPVTGHFELTKSPVSSITSISYLDANGDSQTWDSANYRTDLIQKPARIAPIYGGSYPTTYNTQNAITVVYVAGYGAASAVPAAIKHAIKLLLAEMYEMRINHPKNGSDAVKRLLDGYRVQMV